MTLASSSFPGAAIAVIAIVYVALIVLYVVAAVRIIQRSGYSGWWVLIGLVPIANVVMFFVFAFKESPTERELNHLRGWAAHVRSQQPPGPPPGQPSGW